MATAAELGPPPLLSAGFFTRIAALALPAMTLVIQIFFYPNAFDSRDAWTGSCLQLKQFGAVNFALDRFIEPRLRAASRSA
jgi:putative oxidoreductase